MRRGINSRRAQYVEINPRVTGLSALASFHMTPKPGRDAVVIGAALRTMAERGLIQSNVSADAVAGLPDTKEPMFERVCGVTVTEVVRLASLIAAARRPIFVIGSGVTGQGVEAIQAVVNLAVGGSYFTADDRYRVLEVPRKANAAGVRMFGKPVFTMDDFDFAGTDVVLMFLGDDEPIWPANWLEKARPMVHVSVFASHAQAACEVAHSVAPVATWAQRSGTFVNLEGRLQKTRQLVSAPESVWTDAEILQTVANAMGKSFVPCVETYMPAGVKVAEGQFVPSAEPVRQIVTCKSKAQGAKGRV